MTAMTDYLEGQMITHLFRTSTFSKPADIYVALHTGDPGEAGSSNEVSGNGYARAHLTNADANWAAPTGGNGQTSNLAAIDFPTPTGTGWGTVSYFTIWDASTSGNCLIHGSLTTPKTINNGDPAPSFPIGDLTVTFA